jgi:hypothetical protein
MLGIPVELEKRTVIGVEEAVKWGALESSPAFGLGVKVPLRRMPFAWATGEVSWCFLKKGISSDLGVFLGEVQRELEAGLPDRQRSSSTLRHLGKAF